MTPASPPSIEGLPTEDANGVDLTLVRAMLSRSPTERLRALQDQINFAASIRRVRPDSDR